MKIKSLFILLLFLFISNSFAQFSTKTEYDYLKLINFQQDRKLIKSSIINAQIVANNLVLEKKSKINALFFNELSKSYYIVNKNNESLYYQLLQRVLFEDDSISINSKNRFYDTAFRTNLTKKEIDLFYKLSSKNNLPKTKNNRILLGIKLGTKLHSKKLTSTIFNLGLLLKKQKVTMPLWYQSWEYLTTVGIKEKHKPKFIDYNSKQPLFKILNKKERLKLYSKSINYYLKKHAFKQSKKLMKAYKKENLNILRKGGLVLKKLTSWYHHII
ncbi:MAG TPA: hypothetical protein ENK75_03070 [Saprospiraceae bacterium]|nr:hypothetical protein [Saprospiraceae bacterium]